MHPWTRSEGQTTAHQLQSIASLCLTLRRLEFAGAERDVDARRGDEQVFPPPGSGQRIRASSYSVVRITRARFDGARSSAAVAPGAMKKARAKLAPSSSQIAVAYGLICSPSYQL